MLPELLEPTLILARGTASAVPPPRDPPGERAVRAALFLRLPTLGCSPQRGAHMAHAGGWVAYLAGAAGGSGIDLEWLRPRDVASLASFAYAPEEARVVGASPGERRLQAFYELWVLKEAAGKALGLDLFTALAQARFCIDGGVIRGELPGCESWAAVLYAPHPALRLAMVRIEGSKRQGIDPGRSPACVEWNAHTDDWRPGNWDVIAATANRG